MVMEGDRDLALYTFSETITIAILAILAAATCFNAPL